ncbi:MAG: glycosyltransferase family 4 protein [Pseudomonadota bacterium]
MKHQLHIFPGFGVGGVQRRFAQLYHALPEWRHTVVSLSGEFSASSLCGDGARLATRTVNVRRSRGVSPRNATMLADLIRDIAPDLLCTYNWGSMEAVMGNRTGPRLPHLHFEDGFGPEEANRRFRKRNLVRAMALRGRTLTVVPSRQLEKITKEEWGLPPSRYRYLPNGVDTERFSPAAQTESQSSVVGTVAALRAEKNIGRLLRLASRLGRASSLTIVGSGPEQALLRSQADALGVEAEFTGPMEDTAPAYRQFTVFALTSDTEQMPLTVLEAMASGLPVLATDVGDVKAMVSEENRPFVLPPANENQLSTALSVLLNDSDLRARIGAANRQRVLAHYSEAGMITAYGDLFDEMVTAL